ncbi:MAG: ABC transporter permease [Chloroflexi bacterium]|nr:ABC transporter permease [Chloroflexota bacterium]
MQRYLILRFGQSIVALVGVTMLVFFLTRLSGNVLDLMLPIEATPEDFERVEKAWGLDKPIIAQYGIYMWNVLHGDWGQSWKWGAGALDIVLEKFPATAQLATFTLIISTTLGLSIGMLVAVKKDSPFDWGGKIIALLGQSLPSFWLGIVLMWVFAVLLGWLPTSGRGEGLGGIKYMIMPAITLGWFNVAALMRLTRSAMLEVLDSEYVKLARIKGLPEWKVIWKHCLRNAAIAPLTYFGLVAGFLMTGSVVTETVFAWPGTGLLAVEAVQSRDYQVVQAVVLFMAGIFIFANLVVDVLYAYLDPRIRYN